MCWPCICPLATHSTSAFVITFPAANLSAIAETAGSKFKPAVATTTLSLWKHGRGINSMFYDIVVLS